MRVTLLIGLVFCGLICWSQPRPEIDLENFAERLFQIQDEDINYADLYESLLIYYTAPINLNNTDPEQLASLYILTPKQLNDFFQYQTKNGSLLSIYELQAIPSFDEYTIRKLLPFVTVDEKQDSRPLLKRIASEQNNYLLLRYSTTLQPQEGYLRENGSGYSGDGNTLYGRYRISHPRDFSFGVTFEKDAGESFAFQPKQQQFGFDYYSFHFLLENQGRIKTLALGDYQLQFGQGLVLGSGFGVGKGAETITSVKRNTLGVRPYASVLESGYFRGVATTLSLGRTNSTVFASRLRQDGSIKSDSSYSDFEEFVNSIQATGYHRTTSELAAKNSITETSGGLAIEHKATHNLSFGGTGLITHFSRPLQKKPNNYNQYEFAGDLNVLGSLYANYNWQNFMFFGETAVSKSGGSGSIGGFMASLSPTIDLSVVARRYDKDFHSFYANSLTEGSRAINENGIYWGLKFHPNRRYELSLYFDKFRFPWLRYRVDAPSEGYEYLGRFTFKPSRHVQLNIQYREEHKQISLAEDTNLSELIPTVKRNYLFNIDYALGRYFSLKTRVQGSFYDENEARSHGIAVVQDLNVSYEKWKFSTRFAVFETDDFANAQYLYERNVLYAFSIPAYYGAGTRSYLLIQYRATQAFSLWLRYANFTYNDPGIGSGLNYISSNKRTDLHAMIRYRFL